TRIERSLARRHARVVHDVAPAAGELRLGPVRDERATAARPAHSTLGGDVTGVSPGPWLRTCALLAAGAAILAVVSGEAHLGGTHRAIAALAAPPLAALLVVVVQSLQGARQPWGSWHDYVTLTKPRIMSLLLITGFCGMIAGAHGWPGTETAVAATVGLALACGGASALNHVLDRDIDPLMGARTKRRPVASGRVPASRALEFGLALSALSFVLLASSVNLLTACLALVGNLFYVVVYTRWLKRTTPQNIVIGGAAGAVPPLVGWSAATGHLGIAAWLLF